MPSRKQFDRMFENKIGQSKNEDFRILFSGICRDMIGLRESWRRNSGPRTIFLENYHLWCVLRRGRRRQFDNWMTRIETIGELTNERLRPWQLNNLWELNTIHWVWLLSDVRICMWWKRTQSLLELFALSKTNFPSLVFKLRFAGTKVTILFGEQWQIAPSLSPHFKTQSHSPGLQVSSWINFVH